MGMIHINPNAKKVKVWRVVLYFAVQRDGLNTSLHAHEMELFESVAKEVLNGKVFERGGENGGNEYFVYWERFTADRGAIDSIGIELKEKAARRLETVAKRMRRLSLKVSKVEMEP